MSEDVKPKLYYIVDSSQLNNQPSRVYNVEPKWLAGAVEANKVIELEPTLQLMKEMGEGLRKFVDHCCSWNEGEFVTGSFDSPWTAKEAREAIKADDEIMKGE